MGIGNQIGNTVESSKAIVWDASSVYQVRGAIYERKLQIVKTPMVRDIYHAICNDVNHPPLNINITRYAVYGRQYDPVSKTYNPMNVEIYRPEYEMDYVFACAVCLIIQDIYPNVYDLPNTTMNQLVYELNSGTWSVTLTKKKGYTEAVITPAFNIDAIENIPLENLPIKREDSYSKKYNLFPVLSVILGVLAVIIAFSKLALLSSFPAIMGLIFATISKNTVKKNLLWIVGMITSIVGFALPFLMIFGII